MIKMITDYILIFIGLIGVMFFSCDAPKNTTVNPNIIILIPDGCGVAHYTLARLFKTVNGKDANDGFASLCVDEMSMTRVSTYMGNSIITGSCAASTAFATGTKGQVKLIGLTPEKRSFPKVEDLPESEHYRPAASVLEAAKAKGYATGLIATSEFCHATPAGYAAKWVHRNGYNAIAQQMVFSNLDLLFGGGRSVLEKHPGGNYLDTLAKIGYSVIGTADELAAVKPATRVWGLFADMAMNKELDRVTRKSTEPSIVAMTEKAIALLSGSGKPFFLMVEGSQVDWASHDNDPVGVATDLIAFDNACKAALDFAKRDSNTIILIFPDHDNGGMAVGRKESSQIYEEATLDSSIGRIASATMTAQGFCDSMAVLVDVQKSLDFTVFTSLLSSLYGLPESMIASNPEEVKRAYDRINRKELDDAATDISDVMSRYVGIGWTTFSHTGNDVPMWYSGVDISGSLIDNTDIAKTVFSALATDSRALTDSLYANATDIFKDAVLSIDTLYGVPEGTSWIYRDPKGASDKDAVIGGALKVENGSTVVLFPFNRNYAVITDGNGTKVQSLNGLTVTTRCDAVSPATVWLSVAAREVLGM